MNSITRRHFKPEFSSTSTMQIFSRPRTAKLCSYKKLTEILQGKYMSIQNKIQPNIVPKSSQERKRSNLMSQSQSRPQRRMAKNSSIDNTKKNEKNHIAFCFDFDNLVVNKIDVKKKVSIQKQNNFIPYSKQQNYISVSQPSLPIKNIKKQKKKTESSNEQHNKINKQIQTIESWKNTQQQGMKFSSLFKKSWRF